MQKELYVLLRLLKISLNPDADSSRRLAKLNRKINSAEAFDWQAFLKLATEHSVLSLIYDAVQELDNVPEYLQNDMRVQSRGICLYNYKFLILNRNIIKRMDEEGVKCCILKGVVTAGYYPIPALRKSGDIDILLLDEDKLEKAISVLGEFGFKANETQLTNHHIEMEDAEKNVVELHTMLAEPFDNKKINGYLEKLVPVCGRHIVKVDAMGVELPMLDHAFHAYELLLHMLQHYLRSGFGLKLLCDWVVFWNRVCSRGDDYVGFSVTAAMPGADNGSAVKQDGDTGIQWDIPNNTDKSGPYNGSATSSEAAENCEALTAAKKKKHEQRKQQARYMKLVKESGLKGFSDLVTALCVRYLGLKYECVRWMELDPRYLHELKHKKGLNRNTEAGDGQLSNGEELDDIDEFLSEIMISGEFGKNDDERMVALRGSGITAYVREFHHQMKLNFPKAGKIFVCWPVLWIITLIKFISNNRKYRKNASVKNILKNAGARGRIVKKMNLFK